MFLLLLLTFNYIYLYMSQNDSLVQDMYNAAIHVGYSKTKRHPSTVDYIFQSRQKKDIINLDKTAQQLHTALSFVAELKAEGKQILFVGTKPEAKRFVREQAELIDMPFVTERWLGGTLTNAKEIRSRVERLITLKQQQEDGELVYQTKKEKLMLEREIERLEVKFGGLRNMKKNPAALFVIDSKKEHIAVEEARQMNIPVIALANTDCDISIITHPIVGNDTNVSAIDFITKKVADTLK
jgi:small subunit ribosomal protein S2